MKAELKKSLDRIFFPKSVAIAGVSERMDNPGTFLLRSLQDMGFSGDLYPVNPRHEEILGLKCYPDIVSLPPGLDLAILSIPPRAIPPLIRECVTSAVRGCVINTAGFSETGREEGRRLENEIKEAIQGSELRLVGPNCMGIYSSRGKLAIFAGMLPMQGRVSVISQSGSMASLIYVTGMERVLQYDKVVSSGNELDLNCADYLEYYAEDDRTEMILAYLEEVRDARRFLRTAQKLRGKKPLIILKSGLTRSGGKAAVSHTASIGGRAEVLEGAFRQAGIIQVRDMAEMMDCAAALYHLPSCTGNRVAIISSPGGLAVNSADAVEWYGLELSELSGPTRKELAQILPAEGTSVSNPVDLGFGAVIPGVYRRVLEVLDADPSVDLMLAVGSAPASRDGDIGLLNATTNEILEARPGLNKPIVVVLFPSSFTAPQISKLHSAGVPAYITPTAACKALSEHIRFYNQVC